MSESRQESLVVVDHGDRAALLAEAPHRTLTVSTSRASDPQFWDLRAIGTIFRYSGAKVVSKQCNIENRYPSAASDRRLPMARERAARLQ